MKYQQFERGQQRRLFQPDRRMFSQFLPVGAIPEFETPKIPI
jgi:hypothetical protein